MSNNTSSLGIKLALAASLFGSAAISGTGIYYGAGAVIDTIPDTTKTAIKASLCDNFNLPCEIPQPPSETTASLDTPNNTPRSYIIEGKRDEARTRGPIVIDCDISLAESEKMQRRSYSKCEDIQHTQEFLKRKTMFDLRINYN